MGAENMVSATFLAGISLHRTSQTRWSARKIIEALKTLKDLDLSADVLKVLSLLKWISSFELVDFTTVWFKILKVANNVSLLLQSTSVSLDDWRRRLIRFISSTSINLEDPMFAGWLVSHPFFLGCDLEASKDTATNLGFENEFDEKRKRRTKSF